MANGNGKRNILTPAEQKTTAAFKLLSEQKNILEKSLKLTQDELEKYREKYHEADKNHALQISKNSTIVFHEVLKFAISMIFGGLGVNMFTEHLYKEGASLMLVGLVLYTLLVFFDRKK